MKNIKKYREGGPVTRYGRRARKMTSDLKTRVVPKAVAPKGASALKTGVKKAGLQTSKASVGSGVEKSAKAKREDRRMDRKGKRARTMEMGGRVKYVRKSK